MNIPSIPFAITTWSDIEPTRHPGTTGYALWRTQQFGKIRVRMVEYSAGYEADHWCDKGHISLCLEGEMETQLKDGQRFLLKAGVSYQVGDDVMAHRSSTQNGAVLFIVD